MERYGIPTIQRDQVHAVASPQVHAFERLEADGVIETKRGLGTFVRENAPVGAMREEILRAAAERFASDVRRLGVSHGEALAALKEVWNAGES